MKTGHEYFRLYVRTAYMSFYHPENLKADQDVAWRDFSNGEWASGLAKFAHDPDMVESFVKERLG